MYNRVAQPGCGSPPSGGRVASRTEDEQLLQQEVERGSDPLRKEPRPEHGSGPAAEGAQERPVRLHDHAEHDEEGDGPPYRLGATPVTVQGPAPLAEGGGGARRAAPSRASTRKMEEGR